MAEPAERARAGLAPQVRIRAYDVQGDCAARGLRIDLHRLGRRATKLLSGETDADGALQLASLSPGEYELVFHVNAFYGGSFLEEVPIRFRIGDAFPPCTMPVRIGPASFSVQLLK